MRFDSTRPFLLTFTPFYLPFIFVIDLDNNNRSAMRFKTTWQMLTESLKKSNFLKILRRVLFEQSHLAAYSLVMR